MLTDRLLVCDYARTDTGQLEKRMPLAANRRRRHMGRL